ncbi:hypothetical protein I350_00960 [Cryptococcus amylolentus CBS 6273]|uniref:Uncharacterized protein n=1 Tax=Cryptococcus amylolentus CBS 6273 TaxID=1296118 RepID=A0A1E3KBF8_9TREE|nr:hypothetical protein I350_00960 [Cryptococcus amylolentus CBS 6273]
MSSPFPQLLRRANIATYDPLITRIYTTTPSSQTRHADWGLKFPVHRTKGPRYIKFSSLDAGPGYDLDWRSGEREARFMEAWGSGRVRWDAKEKAPREFRRSAAGYGYGGAEDWATASAMVEKVVEKEEWVRDMESLSEEAFEKYLDTVRGERKRFLEERLEGMAETTKETLVLPEDKTLVHLSTGGKVRLHSISSLESSIHNANRASTTSQKILSVPHPLRGMTYANLPPNPNDFNPATSFPGHALNPVSASNANKGSRADMGGSTNRPLVVSVAGVTGLTTRSSYHPDFATNQEQTLVDFSRQAPEHGRGRFKAVDARATGNPTVLALAESGAGARWARRRGAGGGAAPSPLDSAHFDINFAILRPSSSSANIGSPEWLLAEEQKQAAASSGPILGASRSERRPGQAGEVLRTQEQQQEGRAALRKQRTDALSAIRGILAKHKKE